MKHYGPEELITMARDCEDVYGAPAAKTAVEYLLHKANRQAKADLANATIQPAQKIYNLLTARASQLAHFETPAGQRELWAKQTLEEGW